MIEFSASLAERGLPVDPKSDADVNTLISGFEKYLEGRNLWQYYVFDTKTERESIKAALHKDDHKPWPSDIAHKSVVELAEIARSSGHLVDLGFPRKRDGPHVDGAVAASIVKSAFVDIQDVEALADAWIRVVDVLNVPLYETWKADTAVALDNIKNRVKYTRLDPHGPLLGPITKE
jgi:glycogen debranching enzyme